MKTMARDLNGPPVRLKDIAEELNVSVMTVSKVVRGQTDVSEATRKRVLERVRALNYQPNWIARSLAARQTFIIGLVVPDLMHSFFAEVAKGVTRKLRPRGYDVVICNSEEDAALERSEVEHLLSRQVDGLILATAQSPDEDGLFRKIEARGIPYVMIDRRVLETKAAYVGADNREIGRLATTHLIQEGAKRIGHIAGPRINIGLERLAGYRAALEEHGIEFREDLVVSGVGDEGYSATRKLLSLEPRADGIACFNDPYAINAIRAAIELGLRLPHDVRVIGAGNVHYSDLLRVPLSTIDQQSSHTGEQAAEILLGMLGAQQKKASKKSPKIVKIKPELVIRESTRA
jgi:LacI family transcriptional regulator